MVSLQIKPNTYYDSITLMIISKELKKVPGVKEALVGMGTDLNLDIAKVTGLSSPELEAITPNDFFVALDCENEEAEAAALKALEEQLNKKEESRSAAYYPPPSLPPSRLIPRSTWRSSLFPAVMLMMLPRTLSTRTSMLCCSAIMFRWKKRRSSKSTPFPRSCS
ncbi:MAG: hypothetical protein ACLTY5_02570 [Angelakisella sp.]